MKAVFTTSGKTLNSPLDARFGRAPRFLVYDLDKDTFELLDNGQSVGAVQGAGIQAAEAVAKLGVDCVVTGNCGPKAFRVFSAAGIEVYNSDAPTVAEALEELRTGKLSRSVSANVKGHWA